LHFLKDIFTKYTAWVKAALLPLGPWGVLVIATVDAAALGIPMDPVIVGYVWAKPQMFWLFCLLASAGSAVGSLVPYWVGYKGEELLLEKRIPPRTLEKIRRSFEKHEVLALVVPAMLPPPTPFKLFVLFAGAAKLPIRDFLLAIFAGRMVRFLILSALTVVFGPSVLRLIMQHGRIATAVVAVAALGGVLVWYLRRKREHPEGAVVSEGR
jgi:membrane protein YqaA with SNARE-associated domain